MKRIACLVPEETPTEQIEDVRSVLAEFGTVEIVGSFREPAEAYLAVYTADLVYILNPEGTVDDTIAYLIGCCAKSGQPMYAFRELVGFNVHCPPIRAILPPARFGDVIN